MDEETKPPFPVEPPKFDPGNGSSDSHFFSLSLRGILALVMVLTLCGLVTYLHTDKLIDAFVIIVSGAVTFYFGQNSKR